MSEPTYSVEFNPFGRRVLCPAGTSLLDAAREAGIPIVATCGGKGTCGKCQVKASGPLSSLTVAEEQHLRPDDIEAGYRLACQARVQGPVMVQPLAVDLAGYKAALQPFRFPQALRPNVQKAYLHLPPPTLGDSRADLKRLRQALELPAGATDPGVLYSLPKVMRAADWSVTAVLTGGRLTAVEAGDTRARTYGLACDIGTTTVAAYLVDLQTGRQLAAGAATNGQTIYGDDVITRLDHARAGDLDRLRKAVLETVDALLADLCRQASVEPREVYEAVFVGNTCMAHLFLGIDPSHIGLAPYVPVVVEALDLPAAEAGLELAPRANVHWLPAVAGYVGADAVANVLAAELREEKKVRLIADMGTNAEMVLDTGTRMLACAAAAGPAFEGARISCGMRAAPGAIDQAEIVDGRLLIHTLGDRPALGLAGSGLVSILASLRRNGLLTERGRFRPEEAPAGLFVQGERGPELLLVPASASGSGRDIRFTQKDVAEFLLAKAAIVAAINILLKEAGLQLNDIQEVLLAGSFGNYIDASDAVDIGLVPHLPLERILGVGNSAGAGAILALQSVDLRRRAQELAAQIDYVELSARGDFSSEFVRGMSFPAVER